MLIDRRDGKGGEDHGDHQAHQAQIERFAAGLDQRERFAEKNVARREIEALGTTPERVDLEVRGSVQPALRYRLEAEELGIELWYSENQEWLALEADAAGGRKLRYELI